MVSSLSLQVCKQALLGGRLGQMISAFSIQEIPELWVVVPIQSLSCCVNKSLSCLGKPCPSLSLSDLDNSRAPTFLNASPPAFTPASAHSDDFCPVHTASLPCLSKAAQQILRCEAPSVPRDTVIHRHGDASPI